MFYTGGKFPKWKNNLFIGSLTQQQLIRMAFRQPSQAELRKGDAADGTVLRIEPAQ